MTRITIRLLEAAVNSILPNSEASSRKMILSNAHASLALEPFYCDDADGNRAGLLHLSCNKEVINMLVGCLVLSK